MPLALALLFACTATDRGRQPDATTDSAASTSQPTWHADIAPILSAHCSGCHAAGGLAATLPWTTYDDTAPFAGVIADSLLIGSMPPFPAESTERCVPPFPLVGDTHLPLSQVAAVAAWADAGMPLGDPSRAAPLPDPPSFSLAEYDLELVPPNPITVERRESDTGRVEDVHVCWAFDMGLEETGWLTGLEVLPGNDAVVHHVRIDVGTRADGRRANPQGWFPCEATAFGERAASWVPGARPYTTPAGSALPLPAGTHLVMSVHYHVPTDAPQQDSTRLRVRLSDTPPSREVQYLKIGNDAIRYEDGTGLQPGPNDPEGAEFMVPANTADHTESFTWRVPEELGELDMWLVGHHMHYAGVDAVLTLQRADPQPGEASEQCLLHVPAWDFDWQLFYSYDDPTGRFLRLRPGDLLALRCTYDTTAANPQWAAAMAQEGITEPIALPLSDGTMSEMCASLVGVMRAP